MRTLLIATITGLAVAGPAMAQPDTGHIIHRYDRAELDEGEADPVEAQQAMYDYGACLAKARRRTVERYLATEPFSAAANKVTRQIVLNACLDAGEIQFAPEAIRGPFYQALYRMDFPNPVANDLGKAPTLGYSQRGSADIMTNVRRFADCVVRQNSGGARMLAFSRVGSNEEKAAFKTLMPAMGGCIAPGDKVSFKPPLLRAVMGEVLYRLTVASVGRPMAMDRK